MTRRPANQSNPLQRKLTANFRRGFKFDEALASDRVKNFIAGYNSEGEPESPTLQDDNVSEQLNQRVEYFNRGHGMSVVDERSVENDLSSANDGLTNGQIAVSVALNDSVNNSDHRIGSDEILMDAVVADAGASEEAHSGGESIE